MTNEEYAELQQIFNPKKYDMEVVRVVNLEQARNYIHAGVKPIDVIATQNKLHFVFSKQATRDLFHEWCKTSPCKNT
jgi:hypothetical protein